MLARTFTRAFPRLPSISTPYHRVYFLPKTFHTMPPKLKASGSKRKLEESASDDEGDSTRSASPIDSQTQSTSKTQSQSQRSSVSKPRQLKRAKTEGSGTFENEQLTNTTLPDNIEFAAKNEGCLRISAWNILSLASSQKKVGWNVWFMCWFC